MSIGPFKLDILKALRDFGPLTPVELFEGGDEVDERTQEARQRTAVVGPLVSIRADCGALRKSGLIDDFGMEGLEHRYKITHSGEVAIETHYASVRTEIAKRQARR